ncbi:MAG: hypothetical protein DRP62_02035, partial [Planctomycetota bacterium]
MKPHRNKLSILAVLGLCAVSFAGADLTTQVNSIVSRASQRKVQFSIHILNADTGQTVYSYNSKKAMVPASNMKIVITAAALKYLGPNYEYKTKVGLCGNTLVVTGSGDPLLGDKVTDAKYGRKAGWIFEDIATALRRNGVTAINDIIIDSSIFDDQRVHPNWPKEQLNRWYACEVSGLNFNGNCIDMTVKTIGGKVSVFIEPKTSFVKIINEIRPIQKGKSAVGAYRNQEANKIIVKGKCKKQVGPFAVAIER